MKWSMVAVLALVMVSCGIEAQKVTLKNPTEIILLVDDSGSINDTDFDKVREAVHKFPDKIDMANGKVRIAVVTFATDPIVHLHLTNNETAVRSLPLIRHFGATFTGTGLKTVRDKVFADARPEARKVVILITDGQSEDISHAEEQAELMRNDNATLIAAFIGKPNASMMAHLEKMTNDKELVQEFEKFDDLLNYLGEVVVQLQCDEWPWEKEADKCNEDNAGQTINITRLGASEGFDHCNKTKMIVCPTMAPPTEQPIVSGGGEGASPGDGSASPGAARDGSPEPGGSGSGGLDTWVIAVIVVVALLLIIILVIVAAVLVTRRNKKKRQAELAKKKADAEKAAAMKKKMDEEAKKKKAMGKSTTSLGLGALDYDYRGTGKKVEHSVIANLGLDMTKKPISKESTMAPASKKSVKGPASNASTKPKPPPSTSSASKKSVKEPASSASTKPKPPPSTSSASKKSVKDPASSASTKPKPPPSASTVSKKSVKEPASSVSKKPVPPPKSLSKSISKGKKV